MSTSKRERGNLIRIKSRQRQPDFVRKAGPHGKRRDKYESEPDLQDALDEWAEDYAGKYSIFE